MSKQNNIGPAKLFALSALASLTATVGPSAASASTYMVAPIVVAGYGVSALALNDHGVVVGSARSTPLTQVGFIYSGGSATTYDYGFRNTRFTDINNAGVVVGSFDEVGTNFGVIYQDGVHMDLRHAPDSGSLAFNAVNSSGDIAGLVIGGRDLGTIYSGGAFTDVSPPGALFANLTDINDSGVAIGANLSTSSAFIYDHGVFTDLALPGAFTTTASAINNAGIVVGSGGGYVYNPLTGTVEFLSRTFIYDHGVLTVLDLPTGATYMQAADINNNGVIVGSYGDNATNSQFGFLYDHGQFTSFSVAGQTKTAISRINNLGQFIGSTDYGAFIATPDGPVGGAVPEPGVWAMMLLGLGVVGADLRRRKALAA